MAQLSIHDAVLAEGNLNVKATCETLVRLLNSVEKNDMKACTRAAEGALCALCKMSTQRFIFPVRVWKLQLAKVLLARQLAFGVFFQSFRRHTTGLPWRLARTLGTRARGVSTPSGGCVVALRGPAYY